MAKNIKLGNLVRDRITGFAGIATGRHEFLTGCTKITVQPRDLDKDGVPRKAEWFDENHLDVTGHIEVGLIDPIQSTDAAGGPSDQPRRSLLET